MNTTADESSHTPTPPTVRRLIVAGTRTCELYGYVAAEIKLMLEQFPSIAEIVEGGAQGVDRLARRYAFENDLHVTTFAADWDTYGKSAGPIRNIEMANYGDVLLAIWDGESKGTRHMIEQMKIMGKPYRVTLYSGFPETVEHYE